MAPVTRAMRGKLPVARQNSVRQRAPHRTRSAAQRRLRGSRPLMQLSRQLSNRQPQAAPRPGREVVLNVPVHRRQSAARIAPSSRPIRRQRSIRRAPTIRRGEDLAWDTRDGGSVPVDSQAVARVIFQERDLPAMMDEAPAVERRLLRERFKDGTLPRGFTQTQLVYASIIGRIKPPGMDMNLFVAKLLQRTRNGRAPVSDRQLCIDALDYVRNLLHEEHEKNLTLEAKYEQERIARKQAQHALTQFQNAAQAQAQREGPDVGQLLAAHAMEVDGQDGPANPYPNIEEANVIAVQPARQNLPVICYSLLRHSRALHALLSDQTITPDRLSACLLTTIKLMSDVVDSTAHHPPDHFSKADLRQTLKITSSVFAICLRGLAHLCRDISGRKHKGKVIYALCAVFKSGLKYNEELSQKTAKEAYQIARDHLPPAQRRLLSDLELHAVEVPDLLRCRTEFLASIFLSKEVATLPRPKCYTEVLEGLSAELYTKLGTLVSETVFKEQVAASHLPGHISLIPSGARYDEVKALAIAIERDQVLKLLRLVVARLSSAASDGDIATHSPAMHLAGLLSMEKVLTGQEGNHGRLFKIAKEKMQHTLCKAIFGEEGNEFALALKGARWLDEWEEVVSGAGEMVVNDEGDVFVDGVWEMVGWDILEGI